MWGLSANYSNGGLFLSYAYQRIVDFTAAGVRAFGGIGLSNNTAANNGATGNFKFRPAKTKDGKPGGWDADQKPWIYMIQGGRFTLYTGK